MIEIVREGGMWTAYRDGTSMLYSRPRRGPVVKWAERRAEPGEDVTVRNHPAVDPTAGEGD